MANEIPSAFLEKLWNDQLALGDLYLSALDSTHNYVSGTSVNVSDITTGYLGTDEIVVPTVVGGDLFVANDAISGIMALEFVVAMVAWIDTGGLDGPIVAFMDTTSDNQPMNKEGDGGNMSVQFPGTLLARI